MDIDEGIRTLASWFGTREFRINDIKDEGRLREIAGLIGSTTSRSSLGIHIGKIDGHSCATSGNGRLRLVVKERAAGSKPMVYQIQETQAPG